MAFENWDWDDFLEGIATNLGPGVSTGINLRKAASEASNERMKAARETPEVMSYIRGGYDEPPAPEPNTAFGMYRDEPVFATQPEFNVDVGLEPVEVAPPPRLDLMSAKEARDRERATRMTAFSPETKKFVQGLRDREKKMLIAEESEKAAEVKAGGVKTAAAAYHSQHQILQRAMREMEELDAQEAQADSQAERIAIRRQAVRLQGTAEAAAAKVQEAMEALMNLGAEESDLDVLRVPGQYTTGAQQLINKLTGVSRTRTPGARSR